MSNTRERRSPMEMACYRGQIRSAERWFRICAGDPIAAYRVRWTWPRVFSHCVKGGPLSPFLL